MDQGPLKVNQQRQHLLHTINQSTSLLTNQHQPTITINTIPKSSIIITAIHQDLINHTQAALIDQV
jgi:hypothetical protein